jgi:hypothetical protein
VWLLAMHWLDMIWLVRPELRYAGDSAATIPLSWVDAAALIFGLIALGGVFLLGLARVAGDRPLVAIHEPRMAEALAFENF